MKVSFVTITPDAENLIVYCARVSNPENQHNTETAPRLIKYLINHEHWSPFEMAHMVLEIETSRAISDQLIAHKSFSFQQFSQRYAEVTEFEPIELRKQAKNNRQSSEEIIEDKSLSNELEHRCNQIHNLYMTMINHDGVSRETARMILPICTKTRLYMSGSIRSWIHYIKLRTKPDTQKEHRLIAEECRKIFAEKMPVIAEAAEWR